MEQSDLESDLVASLADVGEASPERVRMIARWLLAHWSRLGDVAPEERAMLGREVRKRANAVGVDLDELKPRSVKKRCEADPIAADRDWLIATANMIIDAIDEWDGTWLVHFDQWLKSDVGDGRTGGEAMAQADRALHARLQAAIKARRMELGQ